MSDGREKRRLAAIMAVDVAGFGRLMEANEEATLTALRQHRGDVFDPAFSRHDGHVFKDMGDALMVEFASAIEAVRCALEIQTAMAGRNENLPEDRHIRFRIGINLADVVVQGDDFYGDDVNVASRLAGLPPPGGIACSAGIRFQLGNKVAVKTSDQGEKMLKNLVQPVHVFFLEPDAGPAPDRSAAKPPSPAQRERRSVAVLPFVNMSGDPEQEFFSDGMTEDVITDLSKVSELFVLSRNTVFQYKGKPADTEQVAKDLGVDYLVHGSVRKAGGRVRITAQLTACASGGHVWAERYDRNLTDIFELQDEITKAIVTELKVNLLPREQAAIEQAPTDNVEAYTCYLKGREAFHRGSKADYLIAKRMFGNAIALDPRYARAYAGLADCDAFLYMDYSEDVAADVLKNSERALALKPDLVEAHASRGLALSIARRYAEAEREFEIAMKQAPDNFELRFFYGRCCYAQRKYEQTALHWERAAEVKPDDYQSLILLNQVYTSLGWLEDANRAAVKGVERAEREFARIPHSPRPAYFIATALAKLGRVAEAEGWARKALAIAPDDYLTRYNIVCFYSVAGRFDQAFSLLEELLPVSNSDMRQWILTDSDLHPLHSDPRWADVKEIAGSTT
jgi:adenylate cyclase